MEKHVFKTKEFWPKFAVIGSAYISVLLSAGSEWLALGAVLFLLLLIEVVFPYAEKGLFLKIATLFYIFFFSALPAGNSLLGLVLALLVYGGYKFGCEYAQKGG